MSDDPSWVRAPSQPRTVQVSTTTEGADMGALQRWPGWAGSVGAVVLAGAVTGCAPPPAPVDDLTRGQQAVAKVAGELGKRTGVVDVVGTYTQDAAHSGTVDVTLLVADAMPLATQNTLLNEAEKMVWTTATGTLSMVSVGVVTVTEPVAAPVRVRRYQGAKSLASLESKYGPRTDSGPAAATVKAG